MDALAFLERPETMSEMQNLDFTDFAVREIEVKFPEKTYKLREASGDVAATYRNESLKCTQFGEDGRVRSVEGMANLEAKLVHYCLLDGDNKRVPLDIIKAWPERYVKQLFVQAKEMSGLDEDTLPSLRKQREALDKKIAKLEAEELSSKNS